MNLPKPSRTEQVEPSLIQRWIVRPIKQQLTQGTSPHEIALAVAFGGTLSIFPIIGSTTLLCLIVGIPLKLNQPILQAFKALTTPLQWALLLGFYRLGESLFRAPHVSLSISKMMQEFKESPMPFFMKYGMTALYGVAVWCLVAPFLIALLYRIAKPLVHKMARSITGQRRS